MTQDEFDEAVIRLRNYRPIMTTLSPKQLANVLSDRGDEVAGISGYFDHTEDDECRHHGYHCDRHCRFGCLGDDMNISRIAEAAFMMAIGASFFLFRHMFLSLDYAPQKLGMTAFAPCCAVFGTLAIACGIFMLATAFLRTREPK